MFGNALQNEIKELVSALFNSGDFKKEMSNYIRMEVEASNAKNPQQRVGNEKLNTVSYEMLTRGNVNMQARMAANGYDVYGRTILSSNDSIKTNDNYMKKMKNKINYGSNPADGYQNKGSFQIK